MTSNPSVTIGRHATTRGARVAGIVSCVPKTQLTSDAYVSQFGEASVADVLKMIGVQSRRQVEAGQSAADLCFAAGKRLMAELEWSSDSVDAILFVSQTPDYRLPATACVLHGRLGLQSAALAFDVNLGCSGYPYALYLAMTMIQSGIARRVLLAVGDTISRLVDPEDRATAMLFGDAGTMTAVEACPESAVESIASFILGTDGAGARSLIVPQGAFKQHSAAEEKVGGKRPDCLYMDGGEIFNFTLRTIPPLVAQSFESDGRTANDYSAFLFHQANLFMLKHLVKKTKLPSERVPINIDRYGNTSCASIPLLLCTELASKFSNGAGRIAMFGFGVGFSWGSACLSLGPLRAIELIEL